MPKAKEVPVLLSRSAIEAIYWDFLPGLKKSKPRIAQALQHALNAGKNLHEASTAQPDRKDEIVRRRKFYGKGKFSA